MSDLSRYRIEITVEPSGILRLARLVGSEALTGGAMEQVGISDAEAVEALLQEIARYMADGPEIQREMYHLLVREDTP